MRGLLTPWRRLAPWTRGLALFFLFNAVLMNALLLQFAGQGGARSRGLTTVYQLQAVLDRHFGTDSWMPLRVAFDQWRGAPEVPLYREIFFEQRVKFQYPPGSLFVPWALDVLGLGERLLDRISLVAMLVTAAFTAALLHRAWREFLDTEDRRASRVDRVARSVLAVGLALTFYPLVRGVANGQIQTWVTALLAAVVWSWMRGHERLAGVLAGVACQLKPQYAVFLLWGVVRRRWGFSAGVVLASAVLGAAALAAFGWHNHVGYLETLGFIARHGEAYFPNQSVNGLLNRALFNGNNLRWSPHAFAPFNAWVYAGTLVSSALLIGGALFWRRGEHRQASTLDLMIALLTFTIASPVAWEHHYGVLLPIYAVTLPAVLSRPVLGWATLPCLGASYALSSNYFGHVAVLAATTPFNLVQSYLLVGAALLLLILYRLRAAVARAAVAAGGSA